MFLGSRSSQKVRSKNHALRRRILIGIVVVILLVFVGFFVKAGLLFNKISPNASFLGGLVRSIPGVSNELKGEEEGRINVALMGMRGENIPGGGLLADTIMVASFQPGSNIISLVSVPRDLYVTVPETSSQQKINAVHFYGEEKERGMGLQYMKQVLEEVTGQPIHYAATINFEGFEQLIDSIGGIDLYLEEPFVEAQQFHEAHVCDPNVFTVPTGEFEYKYNSEGRVKAQYPLCYNANEECGGIFEVPAGEVYMDGETALCYVRSRVSSSDFDRARRQQEVLKEVKDKLLNIGTLSDFGKVNGILNALGDNVRTDMELWEMKRFWELAGQVQNPVIKQKVLENSEEGLLYAPPEEENNGAGYILLPRGGNYEKIHVLFEEIVKE